MPREHWEYPPHIDVQRAAAARAQAKGRMPYGGSESYRFMCRQARGQAAHAVRCCCCRYMLACSPVPAPTPCRTHSLTHCRYFSGFFFDHPLLAGFDYYWRVEPDVYFWCLLEEDPFRRMHARNYSLEWTIMVRRGGGMEVCG